MRLFLSSYLNLYHAKFQRQLAAIKKVDTAATIHEELHKDTTPVLMSSQAITQVQLPEERSLDNLLSKDNKYLEWLFNIKAEKYSIGGDFVIPIFIGAPGDDSPQLYIADSRHVALFAPFGTSHSSLYEKCREGQAAGLQVTGQSPLTIALVERYLAGEVDSLKPQHVVAYLQKNLHWRMTSLDGTRGHRVEVGNLLVAVVTNEVTVPLDSESPVIYAPTVEVYPEITARENGSGRGQDTGYTDSNFVAPAQA